MDGGDARMMKEELLAQNRWAIYGNPAPLLAVVVTLPFATRGRWWLQRRRLQRGGWWFLHAIIAECAPAEIQFNSNHQRPKHLLTNRRYGGRTASNEL